MDILEFITSVTAISGLVGYIGKRFIDRFYDKEIERFKNDLHRSAFEHQIIYSKLHNDRAEVIRQIYAKIVRMERIMNDLTAYITKEKVEEALPAILEAKYFFEENKVFFGKDLSHLIEDFVTKTHNAYFDASWNSDYQLHEIDDDRIKDETVKKRLNGWKIVRDKVPELKEELEKNFRDLLGVK